MLLLCSHRWISNNFIGIEGNLCRYLRKIINCCRLNMWNCLMAIGLHAFSWEIGSDMGLSSKEPGAVTHSVQGQRGRWMGRTLDAPSWQWRLALAWWFYLSVSGDQEMGSGAGAVQVNQKQLPTVAQGQRLLLFIGGCMDKEFLRRVSDKT